MSKCSKKVDIFRQKNKHLGLYNKIFLKIKTLTKKKFDFARNICEFFTYFVVKKLHFLNKSYTFLKYKFHIFVVKMIELLLFTLK